MSLLRRLFIERTEEAVEKQIIDHVEGKLEINLDWFYHSCRYKKEDYRNILVEGIKCNYLLNRSWSGRYNGPFYISLSKVTIPDNVTFLNYTSRNPSFILEKIDPIECLQRHDYEKYINTKDKRRIGNFIGEYQYYYWIKKEAITGILYNLYSYIIQSKKGQRLYMENLLELIDLLEELTIDIPIYDYSRRNKNLAHKIDKDKLKYYLKKEL